MEEQINRPVGNQWKSCPTKYSRKVEVIVMTRKIKMNKYFCLSYGILQFSRWRQETPIECDRIMVILQICSFLTKNNESFKSTSYIYLYPGAIVSLSVRLFPY